MKRSFTISLATPCSEKWETFEPTAQGAFCQACAKEVVDFTRLSDQQIIDFFKNKPKNACGKFRPEQLATYHFNTSQINPGWQLWKAGLIALLFAFVSKPTVAQTPQRTQVALNADDSYPNENTTEKKSELIRGTVLSAEDDSPLPGVSVQSARSKTQTYTDADGKFMFPERVDENDSLLFMFIGLKSQSRRVIAGQEMNVRMENDTVTLGGYIVGGARATNTISFRRWWWKLKNVF